MKAVKITFEEPAEVRIFTDPLNYAGPCGPSQIIKVAAGEVWYAPTNQGGMLMAATQKSIAVENDSYSLFHDLGAISRTMQEQTQWGQIAVVNKGDDFSVKPRVPRYKAQVIECDTLDTTHEDYLD